MTELEEFSNACAEFVPPSYDGDDSQESIILQYLKDMQTLAGIIAKITADYR